VADPKLGQVAGQGGGLVEAEPGPQLEPVGRKRLAAPGWRARHRRWPGLGQLAGTYSAGLAQDDQAAGLDGHLLTDVDYALG
jgi:hypothetical protein